MNTSNQYKTTTGTERKRCNDINGRTAKSGHPSRQGPSHNHHETNSQESLVQQQIKRNRMLADKMSPLIKYRELMKKSPPKLVQRRKFSLLNGLSPERKKTAVINRRRVSAESFTTSTSQSYHYQSLQLAQNVHNNQMFNMVPQRQNVSSVAPFMQFHQQMNIQPNEQQAVYEDLPVD